MKNFVQKLFSRRNLTIVLLTIAGFFGFLFVLNYGLEKYNQNKQWQEIKKSAEMFQKAEQELYQQMMADTYGGKTPQETLQMYIEAVEKGDYELASKYMVKENQEKESRGLLNIKDDQKFLKEYLNDIKKAEPDGEFKEEADETFQMKSKIEEGKPYYFIRFVKYPTGIWKISEI